MQWAGLCLRGPGLGDWAAPQQHALHSLVPGAGLALPHGRRSSTKEEPDPHALPLGSGVGSESWALVLGPGGGGCPGEGAFLSSPHAPPPPGSLWTVEWEYCGCPPPRPFKGEDDQAVCEPCQFTEPSAP